MLINIYAPDEVTSKHRKQLLKDPERYINSNSILKETLKETPLSPLK